MDPIEKRLEEAEEKIKWLLTALEDTLKAVDLVAKGQNEQADTTITILKTQENILGMLAEARLVVATLVEASHVHTAQKERESYIA